jgi:pRiA4b ORF-3-like protein
MPKARTSRKPARTKPRTPSTARSDVLSGGELAALRMQLEDAGAPPEVLEMLDGSADPEDLVERLLEAGLLPSPDAPLDGLLDGWKPLLERGTTPLEAELCGTEFISLLKLNGANEPDLPAMLVELVRQAKDTGRPEAFAMLRVLAITAPEQVRESAAAAAEGMAADGHADLPWMRGLGSPRVRDCFGYGDDMGAQESIVVTFTYGRRSHGMAVLIDHELGGGVKDCWFTDDVNKLVTDVRQVTRAQGIELQEYEPAQARAILDRALAAEPCPAQPDQIEDVTTGLDLVRARVALLPKAASDPKRRARTTRARKAAPPSESPSGSPTVHQLKITLQDSDPGIWRRIEVSSTITLSKLHRAVQESFGWADYHLWKIGTPLGDYGPPDAELDHRSATSKKLRDVAPEAGDRLDYLYDFGDGWEHDILVEAVQAAEPGIAYPRCTDGCRACPPEDCGGIWGYANLVDVLADPSHEEHADLLEWLGVEKADDFDPSRFDLDEANLALSSLARIVVK